MELIETVVCVYEYIYVLCFETVWEIVAQCEPHVDVDPLEVGVLIR
jgi:hypothetical protein